MVSAEFLRKTVGGSSAQVFTINGYKMNGEIVKVLDDMLVIHESDQYKCVMLSAISTVVPVDTASFERNMK